MPYISLNWRSRLTLGGALLLVFITYLPGLSGTFIFDDFPNIVQNPSVHIADLSLGSLQQSWGGFIVGLSGRPLAMLSFGIDHVFWGTNPLGYKLTNLFWHLLNTLLIVALTGRVLRFVGNTQTEDLSRFLPIFVGLLWAIHPLQVSTVLYVVQRMEIMALTFILLALLSYLRGRQLQLSGRGSGWLWLSLTIPLAFAAVLCKETGLLVPVFALCIEITVLGFRASSSRDEKLLRVLYTLGIAIAFLYFLFTVWPRHTGPNSYQSRDFNWQERLLTQLRVLPMYIGWIVWPDPQRYLFFYDAYPKSVGLFSPPTTALGLLFIGSLLATAFWVKRNHPLISLGILLFFGAHFMTSNIVPLELVFEHRNYFAVFAILLAITGILQGLQKANLKLPIPAVAIVLACGFSALTLITSATWGNPLTLALDLAHRNPNSERATYHLGEMYLRMSDLNPSSPFFDMARSSFISASEIPGSSPLPEHALIAMMGLTGQPADPDWWQGLIEKVESGPRAPQHIIAVRTLLDLYNHGASIDPDPLMDAGIALLNQRGLNPAVHFEFALHALRGLDDESLAARILIVASAIANDPAWNSNVIDSLKARGHTSFALELSDKLAAREAEDDADTSP